ncbi:A disintegrin and metalloproteinase with thrombospondin motifs like [Dermacentor andersoni]|uniref:A disintegrin and metalloproteinase with thrombospondin motifs like n=1 Tax=Dermacentor andersoni TaxID=34620 RepID=UPI003B3B265C
MKRPSITFRLVGITRKKEGPSSKHKQATIEGEKALDGVKASFREGAVPGNPDLVFMLTTIDLFEIEAGGKVNKDQNGIGAVGSVCTKEAAGVGEDIPTSYFGAEVMAHELAHILGSPHDETPRCPWSEGYLMSYVDGGTKKYRLSVCSQEKIRDRVRTLQRSCINLQSHKNYMKGRNKIPGKTVREGYYCKKMMKDMSQGRKVYVNKTEALSKKCKMECCYDVPKGSWCKIVRILEGMDCQGGNTCRRGVCGKHNWQ